ncbi:unnamed protein product [Spirodela intermedia]|uniref:Phospholipase A1 EG1, chloroplastic/mitochondrial n=1 Tax=Spirodela intermedia TaxID=51605 RepID=A0A7I8IRC9_SPIIN|nr:unnamed protein product [Spirodela intermedia]CAA6660107.1 unnamed protein product [Spirodela intermedia]
MATRIFSSFHYTRQIRRQGGFGNSAITGHAVVRASASSHSASSAARVAATRRVAAAVAAAACQAKPSLARVWREIQGANDWQDLVAPLHPLLRDEVVRYGEFVNACYKAFDLDPTSKRYLNCKYGKKSLMRELGMERSGYEVTKYIYATPDIVFPMHHTACCSRWMGYVAVSSEEETQRLGRRDVLITFRGTVTGSEWIANLMSSLTPARLDPHEPRPEVKVEVGFLSMYTSDDSTSRFGMDSCREQLLSELSRLITKHRGEELSITFSGHSMGSSLAILAGYDIAELGLNQGIPTTVYSFAGPRVGNADFKARCEELGLKVLRIVNVNDPVTKLPGVFLNENMRAWCAKHELPWSCSCYAHVGVELALDFFRMRDPACVHDLEAYIRLLRCPDVMQVQEEEDDFLLKPLDY